MKNGRTKSQPEKLKIVLTQTEKASLKNAMDYGNKDFYEELINKAKEI